MEVKKVLLFFMSVKRYIKSSGLKDQAINLSTL